MIAIRLPKKQWGKAWRAMVAIAPVRLIADDPIYEILPAHLDVLEASGFQYEVLKPKTDNKRDRRHGKAD